MNTAKKIDMAKLREIRRKKKINLEEMEQHLGVSRELVGKYEHEKSIPRLDLFQKWCSFLGVSLYMIEDEPAQ